MVGILIWGLIEAYVLMEPDMHKDSNMQISMICMAIQWAKVMLEGMGQRLPLHLITQADNTCRDTNATILVFIWGVACQRPVHINHSAVS